LRARAHADSEERVVTHFEHRRIASLLACLALHLHRPYPREVLAEQLWPGEEWDAIRNRLRQALSSLRHDLEPPDGTRSSATDEAATDSVLITNRAEVSMDPAAVTTDVLEFESALSDAARATDATGRIACLRQAVTLYQGELVPGYYEEWLVAERHRLSEAYRDALGALAEALAESGDLAGAVEVGRRLVAADPLREDAHCALMRFYAGLGRTAGAIRQYRDLERVLREELGATPSPATQGVLAGIEQHVAAAGRAAEATPAPADVEDCLLANARAAHQLVSSSASPSSTGSSSKGSTGSRAAVPRYVPPR